MSDFHRVNPTKLYETPTETCKIQSLVFDVPVAANTLALNGVTGTIIRVMGLIAQTQAGAGVIGSFRLKSNSGGTVILNWRYCPSYSVAGEAVFYPITDSGYCETTVSHSLYAEGAVGIVSTTIFYIVYTP